MTKHVRQINRRNDIIFVLVAALIIMVAAAFAQKQIIGKLQHDIEVGVCSDPCPNPTLIFEGQERYGEENVKLWMCGSADR